MYCDNCGKMIPDTSKFCPKCGAGVMDPEPAQSLASVNAGDVAERVESTRNPASRSTYRSGLNASLYEDSDSEGVTFSTSTSYRTTAGSGSAFDDDDDGDWLDDDDEFDVPVSTGRKGTADTGRTSVRSTGVDERRAPERTSSYTRGSASRAGGTRAAGRADNAGAAGRTRTTGGTQTTGRTRAAGSAQTARRTAGTPQRAGRKRRGGSGLNIGTIRLDKRLLAIPVAIVAAFVLVTVVRSLLPKTINMSKYITIETTGYNTVGKASYEFDSESFSDDYSKKFKLNGKRLKKAAEQMGEDVDEDTREAFESLESIGDVGGSYVSSMLTRAVINMFSGELSQTKDLSNGDTVTFTWEYDEELLPILETVLGYTFKVDDVTETVKGLTEIDTVDAFDGVTVSYSGVSPYGSVSAIDTRTDDIYSSLTYSARPKKALSNGDTITVTAESYYSDDEMAERYNKIVGSRNKEYTVSGLDYYPASVSELPDSFLADCKAKAQTQLDEELSYLKAETEEVVQVEYIGNYYVMSTSEDAPENANFLFLMYKVQMHNFYSNNDQSYDQVNTYYWFDQFRNFYITADGSVADEEMMETPARYATIGNVQFFSDVETMWFNKYSWAYKGYADAEDIYNNLVGYYTEREYAVEDNLTDTELSEAVNAFADES